MAMAATIFTISCSGEDGSAGKDGTLKCTVNGTAVVCDGNTIGTLAAGQDGQNGGVGDHGDNGQDGTACVLGSSIGGSFQVICGSTTGVLSGCSSEKADNNPNDILVTCGSTTLNICTMSSGRFSVYNPSEKVCPTTTSSALGDLDGECGTAAVKYNKARQYCGFASRADFVAKKPSVLTLCGPTGISGTPNHAPNRADTTANYSATNASADPVWYLSSTGTDASPVSGGLSGGTGGQFNGSTATGDPARAWDDEYCSVERTGLDSESVPGATKVVEVKKLATKILCGKDLIKVNENAWAGEYCGYGTKNTLRTERTKLNDGCGDGRYPNEVAFRRGYCQMAYKSSPYTTYTEKFCDVGVPDSVITWPNPDKFVTVREVKKFTLLNASDFVDEYCGYKDEADTKAERRSLLKQKVCDDGDGPNNEDVTNWENQYCQVPFENSALAGAAPAILNKTKLVGNSGAYCMKAASSNFKEAGASARLNEGAWKNQYCGYDSKAAEEEAEVKVLVGVCGDGNGPNSGSWDNGYCQYDRDQKKTLVAGGAGAYCGGVVAATRETTGRMNDSLWKSEYCGYADSAAFEAKTKTVLSGFCDKNGNPNAENITSWENQYCQVAAEDKATNKTTLVGTSTSNIFSVYCLADTAGASYATAPATARLNEGTWKNQYCGFKDRTALESGSFSIEEGVCDNGAAPNPATATAWTNDYCQADKDGNTVSVQGAAGLSSVYCGADFASADASSRLNENTWKGQYCFADNRIGVCPGGQAPIANAESSATPRCEFSN